MSQDLTIQVQVKDKSAVLAALRTLGLNAQVDNAGQLTLLGYQSKDGRFGWYEMPDKKCHIKVSRDQIGNACNDFGINLDTGQVYICDYSARTPKVGKFLQEYAVAVATQAQIDEGWYVERIDDRETGKVHLFVTGG